METTRHCSGMPKSAKICKRLKRWKLFGFVALEGSTFYQTIW